MILINEPSPKTWSALCERPQLELDYLDTTVKNILARVKQAGDDAIRELTRQYDGVALNELAVSRDEINRAGTTLDVDLKSAIQIAAKNIRTFHESQRTTSVMIETMPGVTCWRKSVGIERVGIYIPGGTAPLFSTVLMLAIPAQLAGCKDIILCTPPDKQGNINAAILYAASLTGITNVFRAGGAQAIAAMGFGTESIPKVDKIFGPGNQFVTKAKQLINQQGTAIDMPAGPSEVLVMADKTATPSFVAADLLSQAEHGDDSQVMLVTDTEAIYRSVAEEIEKQLPSLPRQDTARRALQNSRAIVLADRAQAIAFVNAYAPEHLIINTTDADVLAEKVINAGSVFIGNYAPEAAGDYASGTNHTLPTNGFARAYSGVSLESFTKSITFQKITREGIQTLGPVVERMAEAEQLEAHKQAVRIRLNTLM
jgi:histidinol dehydrogenase